MSDCLFCKIVAGQIPAHQVYSDGRTLAFLDIHPLRVGHTLVIPKRHGAKLQDLDPQDAAAVLVAAQKMIPALTAAVGAPDATLAIHDGPAAGQEIEHVHLHVVPRKDGDGAGPIHMMFAKGRPSPDQVTLAALGKAVEDRLAPSDGDVSDRTKIK